MSSLTVYAPQITILDHTINMIDGLYSLNDMHKASGSDKKHQPAFFMRNQETKDLIKEVEVTDNVKAVKRVQGGNDKSKQGTYVCKDLVYRYAMWISAKFALLVIRTFDKLVTGVLKVQPTGLSTVTDRKPLSEAVNLYCAKTGSIHSDVWKLVHQRFALDDVYGMTVEQVPLAVEYVHSLLIQARNIKQTPISSFTHNQYIMNVKQGVMDYVYSLQKAIVDSGSPLPKYPAFDTEEICQAFIVSMIRHNRMVLSFGYQDKPTVSFIPDQHTVVSSENIADVVQFADKAQLPSIINEAVKRLGK